MSGKADKKIIQAGSTQKIIIRSALVVIAMIIVFFVGAQFVFIFYFNNSVKEYLQTEIHQQTNGEYQLSIGKIKTNLFNQSIYISGFVMTADKTINPGSPKYFISAKAIQLEDFKLIPFLLKRNLLFDQLKLIDPSGKIYRSTKPEEKKTGGAKKFTGYQLISKYIHSLAIHNIEIRNADINFYDDIGDVLPSIKSRDNLLTISNFRINKEADQASKWFLADSIGFTINKFNYKTKSTLYSLKIKKLVASSGNSSLTLDSIQLIPNYSKKDFGYMAKHQTDRISISVHKAVFKKMNIKLFFERNAFIADDAVVDEFMLDAYRDKNVDPVIKKRAKSLQELVKSIPFYIKVDEIKVKNSDVIYEEVPNGAVYPGRISFDKINGVFKGLTNDKNLITNKSILTLDANCRLMNQGYMLAHYGFPLSTDSMEFDCSAKVTNFPLPAINPTLEPLAYITIKEGTVDTLIFNFHAGEKESIGKMELRYHDVKLKLLRNNDVKNGIAKDIFTLPLRRILALLILKRNNPTRNREVRVTQIYFPKDPYRFIFSYSWKSILSGIKPAIGLPSKTTNRIKEPPPK